MTEGNRWRKQKQLASDGAKKAIKNKDFGEMWWYQMCRRSLLAAYRRRTPIFTSYE